LHGSGRLGRRWLKNGPPHSAAGCHRRRTPWSCARWRADPLVSSSSSCTTACNTSLTSRHFVSSLPPTASPKSIQRQTTLLPLRVRSGRSLAGDRRVLSGLPAHRKQLVTNLLRKAKQVEFLCSVAPCPPPRDATFSELAPLEAELKEANEDFLKALAEAGAWPTDAAAAGFSIFGSATAGRGHLPLRHAAQQ
jgi:hypothetical protein